MIIKKGYLWTALFYFMVSYLIINVILIIGFPNWFKGLIISLIITALILSEKQIQKWR